MEIKFNAVTYKNVLEDINVNFKEGEITSILGKNGSGKSQILDLIYCLDLPHSGDIKIGTKKINKDTKKSEFKKNRNKISYLQENHSQQLYNINIYEDLKCGLKNKINKEYLNELMKIFELSEEILTKNYLEISYSEKKKICLIKIFLNDSKILLLDNPNCGLDYKCTQNLIKLLKRLKHNNKLIILVSQNSEFILQISDKIIAIDNKKIIFDGDKYEFMNNKKNLEKINMSVPNVIKFVDNVLKTRKIKLVYRDNINDLLKDIYRNVK